jgi:ABC-type bacteriocin/lantibiotic exporter with double-glycine peptidase domain
MIYIEQPNDYTCGPIALYNLLSTTNVKISLNKLTKLCKCNADSGTHANNFNHAVKKINKYYKINIREIEPTIKNIDDILLRNGYIIILFHWDNFVTSGEHYAIIDYKQNHKYRIINYSFDEFTKYVTKREMKTLLIKDTNVTCGKCPSMWYIL